MKQATFIVTKRVIYLILIISQTLLSACAQTADQKKVYEGLQKIATKTTKNMNTTTNTAIFAAGCFWCVEAQFLTLKGIYSVESGYIGGHIKNPSYKQICTGTTGHAEAIKIMYNPSEISFDELLMAFFLSHNPTELNRQGADIGTQYRSAIFPTSDQQAQLANSYIQKINDQQLYPKPVVTTVEEASTFYKAEAYHQNYFEQNQSNPYCARVVKPKLEKFKQIFKKQLKK